MNSLKAETVSDLSLYPRPSSHRNSKTGSTTRQKGHRAVPEACSAMEIKRIPAECIRQDFMEAVALELDFEVYLSLQGHKIDP